MKEVSSDKHLVGRLKKVRLEKPLAPRTVNKTHLLCHDCYKYLLNEIASPYNVSTSSSFFRDSDEIPAEMSQDFCSASLLVTLLKPCKTNKKTREAYLRKKSSSDFFD